MSQDFNPYREWLGVTSSNPSPSYYEMLGLRPLEADIGKINAAYQRQSDRLAARLNDSQAAIAQRLMSELAEARMTLMTPTAKRAYDQALAARSPAATASTTPKTSGSAASDVQDILPPAASPQVATPSPAVVPNPAAYPTAMPQPYPGQGYAGGVYPASQPYPAPQGPAMVAQPASPVVPNYYVPPQALASAPVMPLESQPTEGMPSIRRRPVRRRSSSVPALIGTIIVAAGIVGGLLFYYKGGEAVTMILPGDSVSPANSSSPAPREKTTVSTEDRKAPPADTRTDRQVDVAAPKPAPSAAAMPDPKNGEPMPGMDDGETAPGKTATEKPDKEAAASGPESKNETSAPPPDKPTRETKPKEASPEEAAAVAKTLKEVRAALGSRELAKAKDLLDEATIEATAPDTLAQVNRVEMLMSYVEMFWDAARKTLPKLQAAETIEIDGKMVAIVEADEEHLVVRIEGRNREYPWAKIPAKIAYYLADRWLAPDDPVRNLVLAAFEIVEPKGELDKAESLLKAASAARLKAEPLYAELKVARGG